MPKTLTIRDHEKRIKELIEQYLEIELNRPYENNENILKSRLHFIRDHRNAIINLTQ